MSKIKIEVKEGHLRSFPEEELLLKPYTDGFEVTWARRRRAYNTELSMYFLRPEAFLRQMFGFEHEVALFITDFPTLEARTMQAVDILMGEDPARGRIEQSIFFLVSSAVDAKRWVNDYTASNPQARIPVVFSRSEIEHNSSDQWFIRNVLRDQLFSRDLFDYQLPLDNDLFFFGRDQLVAEHLDAIRRSENRGLFGLRKTGKTSLLYKVKRLAHRENIGAYLYYDCKLPSIRMLRWHELMAKIAKDISAAYKLPTPKKLHDPIRVSDALLNTLDSSPPDKVTALVFDEIEYISPLSIDDTHWHKDFIPFWQTLWSAQSQIRRLSTTVAGVNPFVVETDTFGGIQNPMFGIVQLRYLRGFNDDEMRGMTRFFGRRMGITFELDASSYLYERYGGHPLLTRMACSQIHDALQTEGVSRPAVVDRRQLIETEDFRDAELVFYCRHVVSELKKFYPDEYELLELISRHQIVDAMDLAAEPEYTRHLKEYGLLRIDSVGRPVVSIPVVAKHVAEEAAKRDGEREVRQLVKPNEREPWTRRRTVALTREIRELSTLSSHKSLPELYGDSSFPEAERFADTRPVSSRDEFVVFVNICNRCFVESVERVGKRAGKPDYFWTTVKSSYPDLWNALHRIKLYRNNDLHLDLNPKVEADFQELLLRDLEGKRLSQVEDPWFRLQQIVLDDLLVGVLCELNRYG